MSMPAKPEDQIGPVPSRPPGQRLAPVQVISLVQKLSRFRLLNTSVMEHSRG